MPIEDTQITHKQHAVPQNIMDVEFKIIGDLTMRQFFYLLVCSALAYASFSTVSGIFKWPLTIVFVGLGLSLAFLPIEERGLDQWIINFLRAVYANNQSIWRKEPQVLTAFSYQNIDIVKQEIITLSPTSSRRKLEEFLETYGDKQKVDPLDIPETAYLKKVREAFVVTEAPPAPPAPVITPSIPSMAPPTPQQQIQEPEEELPQREERPKTKAEIVVEQAQQQTQPLEQKIPAQKKEVKQAEPEARIELPKMDQEPLAPITPDRHSGRMFTNLLPKQGEIVLPIRGEKVLKTSDEQEIEEDINEKAEQLKRLLEQIKNEEGIDLGAAPQQQQPVQANTSENVQTPLETPTDISLPQASMQPPQQDPGVEATLEQLRQQNRQLMERIAQLQQEINKTQAPQEKSAKITQLHELQEKQSKTNESYTSLRSGLSELKDKVFVKKAIEKNELEVTASKPMPKINIVSGFVKDPQGKALEGIVLIIKNNKGEPVRALKTNALGHFSISTPLANGSYTLETDKANATRLSFDIININANGQEMIPLEIAGRATAL